MTDKNEPKIRMVTLDKKSPSRKVGSRAEDCDCEGDNCPECRVQIICSCDGDKCKCDKFCPCDPICSCHPDSCPCQYEVPCSNTTIPSTPKSENNQKEQQTPKEGKGKPRTFFKIAENKK